MDDGGLPEGLYEALVTRGLADRLGELTGREAFTEPIDPATAHLVLSRHLARIARDALRAIPASQRPAAQTAVTNMLLEVLADQSPTTSDEHRVLTPAKLLTALLAPLLPGEEPPARPAIPLSENDLLVNSRDEPAIGHELQRELQSADRVDLLIAFVKWYGVRILRDELAGLRERGVPLRVLTTTYLGATERKALDWLVDLGANVQVSYERSTTRLHAKAWLFHRESGYSTAYIGSSNLSKSALLDGLEWNVRLSEVAAPEVLAKFRATFESYWAAGEFEPYDPERDAERFDAATASTSDRGAEPIELSGLEIRPWHYQREILEALEVERTRHDRWHNLVVAPTGTGKTVVAALDYRRLREEEVFDGEPSLLFVAHRERILTQSLRMFREVLGDGAFGELLVGGRRPRDWRHVFASIQSLTAMDVDSLDPDRFTVVIVDEFHHAAAPTYETLIDHLDPTVLLGLTATPERTDGDNVKRFFGDRYAFEMRLWDALDEQLLAPFQYFGVADDVDLSQLEWTRGGYRISDLDNLYTGNDARVAKVLRAIRDIVTDVHDMRAFGFCVSKAHAAYMARRFSDSGIPATHLVAETPEEERQEALRRLRTRELNVVFAVDLLTEGVDVPEVDTILLLRPTESATVFLQQIGRGLRKTDHKACCTILDFIGQQHRRFRFDLRLRAMTGATRSEVIRRVEEGFPFLPAGCHMELDRQSEEVILDDLRRSLRIVNATLVPEVRDLHQRGELRLQRLLEETGAELHEIYKPSVGGWTRLRRRADLEAPEPGPEEPSLARALGRSLHWDDDERLELYGEVAAGDSPPELDGLDDRRRRLLVMLHLSLWGLTSDPATLREGLTRLWDHPGIVEDLRAVLPILAAEVDHVTRPLGELPEVPLQVHARYSRDEVLAAFGELEPGSTYAHREGVWYDEATNTDVFLVTLHKSEADYSPTTMYEDYAISPRLFHWQSQSTTSRESPTGQRYLGGSSRVLLFVRERKEGPNGAAPYLNLGTASFGEARGDRPISITWQLDHPMPEDAYHGARVAATA